MNCGRHKRSIIDKKCGHAFLHVVICNIKEIRAYVWSSYLFLHIINGCLQVRLVQRV